MPDRPTLPVSKRSVVGKKVKALRREGKVPAIIYGTVVEEPLAVTVDTRELDRMYHDYGNISLIDVTVEEGDDYTVYIRNVQAHPISRRPLHAEFFAPNLLVVMTTSIPVNMVGESPNFDGVVTQVRDTIEVEGLPTDIPGVVEVDVSELVEIDDSIYASEISLPETVTLMTDPEELLVRLMEVRVVEEEEEVEEIEGEELPEGEVPEGEEAAEGAEEAAEEE